MTDPDLIGLFIEPLERVEIRYMITGGVASVIYGDPRFTRDIDVVLELPPADVSRLTSVFAGEEIHVPPREALEEETARPRGGHFNLIHPKTGLRADVYLAGDDPFHAWAFENRNRLDVETTAIWVAPIEYVILRKIEYYGASGSERHLRDVAMMLRISGEMLDREAFDRWTGRLDLQDLVERARGYSPPDL